VRKIDVRNFSRATESCKHPKTVTKTFPPHLQIVTNCYSTQLRGTSSANVLRAAKPNPLKMAEEYIPDVSVMDTSK